MTDIQKRLFRLQDKEYCKFQGALIPNIDKGRIIGVRTPKLKALAKEIHGSDEAVKFTEALPHEYFEENQLHAFLISLEKDEMKCLESVKSFLPYVDNWATCDQLSPKCFYKHPEVLEEVIPGWLGSEPAYEVRFGIVACMRYFLGDNYKAEYAQKISEIRSEEYYIKMAVAWYFATALAKNSKESMSFITEKRLDTWTHNKTIQKACESYRISDEQKEFLKKLKV